MQIISGKPRSTASVVGGTMLLCGLLGCSQSPPPEQLLAQARQFGQQGQSKAAIIQLKSALQLNPANVDARLMLAGIYLDAADPVSAEKEVRMAIGVGLAGSKALPLLCRALLAQQKYDALLQETGAEEAQSVAEVLSRRGEAYLGLNQLGEAEAQFRAALQKRPGLAEAITGLARLAAGRRNLAEAGRLADQAIAADPGSVDAWLFKGDLARATLQPGAAHAAYDHVVALDAAHLSARLQRACLDIEAHRFEAARAELAALRKSAPGNLLVLHTQALLAFTEGDAAAALEPLQQVLKDAPEHMPTLLLAGAVQFKLGAMAQAEQHLRKYLQSNPGNLYARKLLASTLLAGGRAPDALALLEPVLKDAQDVQLLSIAGSAYMETRQHAKARDCFAVASARDPSAVAPLLSLGLSKLSLGERDAAVADMERALRRDPQSLRAGVMLVTTLAGLAQDDKALAAVLTLEQAHPESETVQNLKGALYLSKNNVAQARASFEKALALQPAYFVAADNLAKIDLRARDPDAARRRYSAFLEQNRNDVEAMRALADLATTQGRTADATAWLERAAAVNPQAVKPAMRLAAQYLTSNQRGKALALARKLQVDKPDNTDVLDMLAIAQLGNGDLAGSLETYSRLAVMQPQSASVQRRLASVYLAMNNPAAAAAALGKAVQLRPVYPDAQLALANLLIADGRHAQAIGIARQLQQQQPDGAAGYALEGDAALAQKKPAAAAAAYQQALRHADNPQLLIKLCEALRQAGLPARADSRLAQWRRERPDDLAAALYQGERHAARGDHAAAAREFEAMLRRAPDNPAALNNLAWSYHQMKDARALATAEQALRHAGASPAVQDTLGWILVERGEPARGLPLLREAVRLRPGAPELRYHLAIALARGNDRAGARRELQYLFDNHRDFPQLEGARALFRQL